VAGKPHDGKYNSKKADKLIEYLKLGIDINEACALVEINKGTYYNWLKKHEGFNSRAGAARANMEARYLAIIAKAAQGDGKIKPDVKAAMWALEKGFPGKYGYQARLKLEAEVKSTLDFTNEQLTTIAKRFFDRKKKK
jgi:hypothetical protein